MKRDSTITFNYFSFIVLFFIVCSLTSNSSQAFEIKNKTYNKKQALTNEDISTKLILADKHRISDPTLFKELLFELREQPNITTEQEYYLDLLFSYHLTFIGKYKIAESKLNNIIYSNANNLIKFRANYALIYISMPKRDWLGGLKYLTKNISLLPTIDNNEHYQNGLVTTIIFYNKIRQYKLALSYINKLKDQPLTKINSCLLKQLSLETKFNLNKLISDDGLIDDAIETCEQVKFDIATNIIIILKAKLYLNDKTPDRALSTLLPFIVNTNNTHYPMLIAEMNNVIAKAYWQINDIDNAQIYATKALTINKGMTNILQGVETYFLLYQIAKKQQDLSLALRYFEQYSEIEKRHLEGEKAKHLAFQLAEHNSFAQESQIKLLNEKNNALAAEQALAKTQAANRKLVILLLGVVILAFTFIGIRFSRSHKRVKELAEYDPLTGIFNRGHFTHVTNSALKYCKNAQQDLSVIMFDLDHFKKVNDSFGHACGDWALKETIKVCQNIGRKNDIFARLGGEEFCLVLTSCTIDVAMLRAEACRAAIEEIITEESNCEFSITASFGVTDLKRSGFTLDKLLADADMAAYASKNAGRNRVTMFEVPETSQPKKLDNSWNYEK